MTGTIGEFIEGLKIAYENDMDKTYIIQAEHDIIYVGGEHIEEGSESGKKLEELGFHMDDECWCYFT